MRVQSTHIDHESEMYSYFDARIIAGLEDTLTKLTTRFPLWFLAWAHAVYTRLRSRRDGKTNKRKSECKVRVESTKSDGSRTGAFSSAIIFIGQERISGSLEAPERQLNISLLINGSRMIHEWPSVVCWFRGHGKNLSSPCDATFSFPLLRLYFRAREITSHFVNYRPTQCGRLDAFLSPWTTTTGSVESRDGLSISQPFRAKTVVYDSVVGPNVSRSVRAYKSSFLDLRPSRRARPSLTSIAVQFMISEDVINATMVRDNHSDVV